MKWVLFKKNSISENSDSSSETGFNSVRVLMTKVRYIRKNMPDKLSNNTEMDIMELAMKETMIKSDPPLYDFQISELADNTYTPYKYHFR